MLDDIRRRNICKKQKKNTMKEEKKVILQLNFNRACYFFSFCHRDRTMYVSAFDLIGQIRSLPPEFWPRVLVRQGYLFLHCNIISMQIWTPNPGTLALLSPLLIAMSVCYISRVRLAICLKEKIHWHAARYASLFLVKASTH